MINDLIILEKFIGRFLLYTVSVCICGFIFCSYVFGLDREQTIAQFHHTAWTAKEGVPGAVRAIAQTKNGYLWLGSSNGLYRFDGIQFDHYEPQSGSNFPSKDIYSLLVTPDDGLWIGYWFGGASFLKDGNLTNYSEAEGLPSGRFSSFARDDEETIWFAATNGLARFDGSHWQRIGADWNYSGKSAQSLSVDSSGTLWVATEDTIVFLPKGSRAFQATGEHVMQVLKIVQSPEGSMWMSETMRSVRQIQTPESNRQLLGPEIRVGSKEILFDREGALWVTSLGDGIRRVPYTDRLRGQTINKLSTDVDTFTEKDGLSGDFVFTAFEDREGNIWIGTAGGLDRFRENDLLPIRFPPGEQNFALAAGDGGKVWIVSRMVWVLNNGESTPVRIGWGSFSAIFKDDEDTLWVGGAVGIHRIRENVYSEIARPPVPKSASVSTIFKDRQNVFWFYFAQEGIFQLKNNGIWSRYDRQTELPELTPISGSIDSRDRKWFGYLKNNLAVIDGVNIRTFSRDNGLDVGDIKAIQEGDEHIWVGGTTGVAFLNGDRFQMLLGEGSAEFSGVSGIVAARDGSLWLNESLGIIHIPTEEIRLALENPMHRVKFRLFDFLDGLPGTAQQGGPFPTAIEGSDGRIWFSTTKGVVWIDPNRISKNSEVPPVSIRSVITDEKSYDPLPSLQLPKGTKRLQIDFTALSLSIPERVRFRYRLEGIDEQWQETGTRREAFYTNLGPGSYHFQVIAANNDGVWNETGAILNFTIQPAIYQTLWFRLASFFLALLFVGVIIRLIYNRRISLATEQLNTRFEERLRERNRISQELHDTLLQGFLGITMRLQAISNILPAKPEKAKENLDNVLNQVDLVLEEGRRGIWDIKTSTVTENDLGQALTLAGGELNKTYPANFTLTIEGESRALHPLIRDEVYRIGREALTNAFHHSKATEIEAGIEYSLKYLRISIRDNGCGISPDFLGSGRIGHLGLTGMRESAEKIGAELKIWSRSESGTEVELIVPHHIAFRKKTSGGFFNRLNNLVRRKKPARDRQKRREK